LVDSQTILQQIKKAVLTVDPGAELILFGSRARGDYNEESDWDVLVLSEHEINMSFKDKISDKLFYLELDNDVIITPVIVNKEKWYEQFKGYPLFHEVKKDGIAL
jgi:predicted nucleotidyltransferase